MLTASEVAGDFIARSRRQGRKLSNTRLQCFLYYAQAWHLALFDCRLFADQIEAQDTGPVMPLVVDDFDRLSSSLDDNETVVIDDWTRSHLDAIQEKYGSMGDDQLRAQIQSEAPWLVARATPQSSGRLVIDLTDMKLFYRYPASDIFIRVVYGLCRALMRLGVYQVGLAVSRWVRKAWEAWKILCSFFCMSS